VQPHQVQVSLMLIPPFCFQHKFLNVQWEILLNIPSVWFKLSLRIAIT
jgi:hypothetical protein